MKTEIKKKAPVARVPDTPAVQRVVYQSDVTPANGTYILAANDVKANLAALDTAIGSVTTAGAVTVRTAQTPETGYLTTYEIWQGSTSVQENLKGKINIPKDFLVKSAKVGTVTAEDKAAGGKFENDDDYSVGDKYIDFVLNTADTAQGTGADKHVYINVNSLVDIYTAQQNATQVQLAISAGNEISATIVAGSIGTTELSSGVNASLVNADNAVQGVKLDGASSNLSKDSNNVVTIPNAVATGTGETNGLMTAADKAKLNGIATGAEVNVLEKVKVGGTALTVDTSDKSVNLAVDGAYDSSTNKVATQSTVTNAIDGLDVSEYAQGSVLASGGTTTIKIKGIKEVDGKIEVGSSTVDTELVVDGEYNAAGNKIATVGSITTKIANKADKAVPTTAGNFAALDASGNLTDSGKAAGDFKTKQTAVSAPTSTSGDALAFVDGISQNANGEIEYTTKAISTVSASTSGKGGNNGLMLATDAEKLAGIATGAQVNVLEGVQINGTDLSISNKKVNIEVDGTYNSSTNKVATQSSVTSTVNSAVNTAIHGLYIADIAGSADKTISTVTESSGKVNVTFQPIQIAESQVTGLQTDLAGKASTSDVEAKATKVTSATSGHFAGLDSHGDLTDSGYSPSDFQAAGNYKTTQTDVSDPTANGNAIAFIDTISQNANGEVSVTKKTVDTDGSTLTVASNKLKVADGGIGTTQLAVLDSFQIMDATPNSSSNYYRQKYTVQIIEGVLTINPAGQVPVSGS